MNMGLVDVWKKATLNAGNIRVQKRKEYNSLEMFFKVLCVPPFRKMYMFMLVVVVVAVMARFPHTAG